MTQNIFRKMIHTYQLTFIKL